MITKIFLFLHFLIYYVNSLKHIYPKCLKKTYLYNSNINEPSTTWKLVSSTFKNKARSWFIDRAEKKNVPWRNLTSKYNSVESYLSLKQYKLKYENTSLEYPDYYVQPFHGYDDGNMNWLAAKEAEAATYSMATSYWKNLTPYQSQDWMRQNITTKVQDYINKFTFENKISQVLDIGCSIGISTEYIQNHFNESKVYGLDLSPYFVALGNYRVNSSNLSFEIIHGNAESMPFQDNKFDLIMSNFLLHEVPPIPTDNIIKDCYRILKPGGILAIIDLNTDKLQNNFLVSTFRKWAFEVTEPHIYQYYNTNLTELLTINYFKNVKVYQNDPINNIWIGQK
jgi:ubiquinone/menaquinone biosynthesis C-methylase UbiE